MCVCLLCGSMCEHFLCVLTHTHTSSNSSSSKCSKPQMFVTPLRLLHSLTVLVCVRVCVWAMTGPIRPCPLRCQSAFPQRNRHGTIENRNRNRASIETTCCKFFIAYFSADPLKNSLMRLHRHRQVYARVNVNVFISFRFQYDFAEKKAH